MQILPTLFPAITHVGKGLAGGRQHLNVLMYELQAALEGVILQ